MDRHSTFEERLSRIRSLNERAAERAAAMTKDGHGWPSGPDDITPDHPLARAIGLERAKAIFAPSPPPKPKRIGPTPLQQLWAARRTTVAQRLAEGATLTRIAQEMGVTPSRIWQIRKALGL